MSTVYPTSLVRKLPYITVSAKGLSNGQSSIPNDGADFGPDTMQGATAPNQYGPPYTQTYGIQEAINYAANIGVNLVKLLPGTYYVNQTIIPPSNIHIKGSGRGTIVKPTNTFSSNRVLHNEVCIFDIGGTDHVIVSDMYFDTSEYTGSYTISSVGAQTLYVNNAEVYNIEHYTTSPSGTLILFQSLAVGDNSHNIKIHDIVGWNGNTVVGLYGNATQAGMTISNIEIYNIIAIVTISNSSDTRVSVNGNYPAGTTNNQLLLINVDIHDIYVYVAPSAGGNIIAVGNGTGTSATFIGTHIHNIYFYGNSNVNGPLIYNYGGNYGLYINTEIDHVYGYYSGSVRHFTQPITPSLSHIHDIYLYNNIVSNSFAVEVYSGTEGNETAIVENVVVTPASGSSYLAVVGFTGGAVGQNFAKIVARNIVAPSISAPIVSTNLLENGTTINYGNTNFYGENLIGGGAPSLQIASGVKVVNSIYSGFNSPSTPSVPSSGTAQQNTYPYTVEVALYGGTVTEITITRNGTTYTVFSNSSGAALSGQTYRLDPGDSITLTYSSAPTWTWLPA